MDAGDLARQAFDRLLPRAYAALGGACLIAIAFGGCAAKSERASEPPASEAEQQNSIDEPTRSSDLSSAQPESPPALASSDSARPRRATESAAELPLPGSQPDLSQAPPAPLKPLATKKYSGPIGKSQTGESFTNAGDIASQPTSKPSATTTLSGTDRATGGNSYSSRPNYITSGGDEPTYAQPTDASSEAASPEAPPQRRAASNAAPLATNPAPRRFENASLDGSLPSLEVGARTLESFEEAGVVAAAAQDSERTTLTAPNSPKLKTVDVYFATDRRPTAELLPSNLRLFGPAAGIGMVLCGLSIGCMLARRMRFLWIGSCAGATTLFILASHQAFVRWQQVHRLASDASTVFSTERYESRGGYPLNLGVANISLPPIHEKGKLESVSIAKFEVIETPDKHIVLHRVEIQDTDTWFNAIRSRTTSVEEMARQVPPLAAGHGAFVFVHGYNVRFDDALKRTAQLSTDLEIDGPAICFSWPSRGNVAGYTADESTVNWSAPHFEQLILDLRNRSGVDSINIIAHSMGNRALLQAVERIGNRLNAFSAPSPFLSDSSPRSFKTTGQPTAVPMPKIIDRLVMAAPDVDIDAFTDRYTMHLKTVCNQATLYFSSADRALWLSKLLHGNDRVGLGGNPGKIDGIDAVDIGAQSFFSTGHSYYGSDPAVIDDLAAVLLRHEAPEQRLWLEPMALSEASYWRLNRDRHATAQPNLIR